jgi:large subunit ribosomal protein L6
MVEVIEERIKIPEKVEVELQEGAVKIKGPNGEVMRRLYYPGIQIAKEGREIIVRAENPKKMQKAIAGTFASHIRNMLKGVTEGFEYKMKVVYSHFPITVKVAGKEILVENYLGEKTPRKTQIVGNCAVRVKGTEVAVLGSDVEEVGQTVANIEQLARAHKKDIRVFQDGIYLVERDGVKV